MRLDSFDLRLLAVLQRNADATHDELAELTLLSRSQCSRRVQRLRDEGLIERVVALLDPERIGLSLKAYVMITLRSHSAEDLSAFAGLVTGSPQVLECCMLTGDADYLLKVYVADLRQFDDFLRSLLNCPPIATVRSSIVLRDLKRTTELPLPS